MQPRKEKEGDADVLVEVSCPWHGFIALTADPKQAILEHIALKNCHAMTMR
jgi:hypothetical protein